MIFLVFALTCLKEFRLLVKGSFLNLRRAAFLSQIAILHSSLNQGVLRLFEGEVFDILSFAIAMNISVICLIRTVVFGSRTSLLSHKVLNCCQSALLVSQFFASHNLLTYVQGFVRVAFDRDVVKLGNFQQEISIFSFFHRQRAEFHFLIFLSFNGPSSHISRHHLLPCSKGKDQIYRLILEVSLKRQWG